MRLILAFTLIGATGFCQTAETPVPPAFIVVSGTRVPLTLINGVSSKHAAEGDRVYLESAFPVMVNGKIVIPPGSYVTGTITEVKRPGRVKGKGELYIRFDSMTLPNGVTREFRARIGGMDSIAGSELDRKEGTIRSEGNKGGDARTVGEATAAGASIGAIAGSAAGHAGQGLGIGAAAGAAAGIMGVLLSRGPDAILPKGSTVEMVLDRSLTFTGAELDFGPLAAKRPVIEIEPAPPTNSRNGRTPMPGRIPF